MNKIMKGLGAFVGGLLIAVSCDEISFGNDFLGDKPESSGATTEEMFSKKINAEKVLVKAYNGLPYGVPTNSDWKLGYNVIECITDLAQSFRDNINDGPMKAYYNGSLSATNVPGFAAYRYAGMNDWTSIRYAWLFIEHVGEVPDMTDAQKAQRIAEAKMIIAMNYFEMLRYVGGVPYIDHCIDVNEEMTFPRQTFEQTVENIISLLDQAIPNLPWKQEEVNEGRMTSAGAMALKFKVLHFAASPMFNSDKKWHENANEFTCYGNYSVERWKRAEKAAQEFFAALKTNGQYELEQPEEATHEARRLAYRKAYYQRTSKECLISTRKGFSSDVMSYYLSAVTGSGPTLNWVMMFPWEDGSKFPEDFNWENPSKQPFFEVVDNELVPTRDPRLYENIACPGETYMNGSTAPVYTNHPRYADGSGFLQMKFVLRDAADRSTPAHWCSIRLPEIMLGYAEVLNEINNGPTAEARQMVNTVRARVGLKEIPAVQSKEQFTETLLNERALEFGYEEVRWFDIIRRDLGDEVLTKELYGLRSKADHETDPKHFKFKKVPLIKRYWHKAWDKKWYLAPIPQDEINKDYGMTQNPGW